VWYRTFLEVGSESSLGDAIQVMMEIKSLPHLIILPMYMSLSYRASSIYLELQIKTIGIGLGAKGSARGVWFIKHETSCS
jgi:hypothetical protein